MTQSSTSVVNLVILGEQGTGKSTLVAKLLSLHGEAADKRSEGATVDCYITRFRTAHCDMTVFDTPGNGEYVKNAVTAMACADCAVLVVSAAPGEYEAGLARSHDHALLAYQHGVHKIVVAVNKIDSLEPEAAQARFDVINKEVVAHLKACGYNPRAVAVVPISALRDDNVMAVSDSTGWFRGWNIERKGGKLSGTTLVDALDEVVDRHSLSTRPLRVSILDVHSLEGTGTVAVGQVLTGELKTGMSVLINPGGKTAVVTSLEFHHHSLGESSATPGMCVGFGLSGVDSSDLRRGCVVGDVRNNPPLCTRRFLAEVIVLNCPGEMHVGYAPEIDVGTAHFSGRMSDFIARIDGRSGVVLEEIPKMVRNGDSVMAWITPINPAVVESFTICAPLGRFTMRDNNSTVAVGVIKEVVSCSPGEA